MHRSSIKQVLFWDAIAVLVGFRRNISVGEFIPCRGEAVYGTLGQCAGCAAVARSSALLSPGAGALDGRGRETPQRRTALQERQRRRLPAQRRESRVFPGRSSRSLSYRGILRGAAPELAGRSSPASIHRAGPGALHGCGRARKKPPRLQSSGPSARPNRAVEQSNGAPRHRHRECIWNQAPRTWDEHRIQSNCKPKCTILPGARLWSLRAMLRGRYARLLRQPHQFGHRNHSDFLHHASAVGLDRAKRDAEFRSDLFVE